MGCCVSSPTSIPAQQSQQQAQQQQQQPNLDQSKKEKTQPKPHHHTNHQHHQHHRAASAVETSNHPIFAIVGKQDNATLFSSLAPYRFQVMTVEASEKLWCDPCAWRRPEQRIFSSRTRVLEWMHCFLLDDRDKKMDPVLEDLVAPVDLKNKKHQRRISAPQLTFSEDTIHRMPHTALSLEKTQPVSTLTTEPRPLTPVPSSPLHFPKQIKEEILQGTNIPISPPSMKYLSWRRLSHVPQPSSISNLLIKHWNSSRGSISILAYRQGAFGSIAEKSFAYEILLQMPCALHLFTHVAIHQPMPLKQWIPIALSLFVELERLHNANVSFGGQFCTDMILLRTPTPQSSPMSRRSLTSSSDSGSSASLHSALSRPLSPVNPLDLMNPEKNDQKTNKPSDVDFHSLPPHLRKPQTSDGQHIGIHSTDIAGLCQLMLFWLLGISSYKLNTVFSLQNTFAPSTLSFVLLLFRGMSGHFGHVGDFLLEFKTLCQPRFSACVAATTSSTATPMAWFLPPLVDMFVPLPVVSSIFVPLDAFSSLSTVLSYWACRDPNHFNTVSKPITNS